MGKLGMVKTSYLLAHIVNDRMDSFDIMDPCFTLAVDRLAEGADGGLGAYLIRIAHVPADGIGWSSLIDKVLWWSDEDCRTVFNLSRKEILDMIG